MTKIPVAGSSTKLIPETPIKKRKTAKKRALPINDVTPTAGTAAAESAVTSILANMTRISDDTLDEIIPTINPCMTCGEDMGECNPRQLCGKTRCLNKMENDDNVIDGGDEVTEDSEESIDENAAFSMEKKQRRGAFLSVKDFTAKSEMEKPVAWSDLDQKQIYYIRQLKTKQIPDGKRKRLAFVAEIEAKDGSVCKAWFPGCAGKSVAESIKENPNRDIYIQPLGKKYSPKSGRTYNNFNLVPV